MQVGPQVQALAEILVFQDGIGAQDRGLHIIAPHLPDEVRLYIGPGDVVKLLHPLPQTRAEIAFLHALGIGYLLRALDVDGHQGLGLAVVKGIREADAADTLVHAVFQGDAVALADEEIEVCQQRIKELIFVGKDRILPDDIEHLGGGHLVAVHAGDKVRVLAEMGHGAAGDLPCQLHGANLLRLGNKVRGPAQKLVDGGQGLLNALHPALVQGAEHLLFAELDGRLSRREGREDLHERPLFAAVFTGRTDKAPAQQGLEAVPGEALRGKNRRRGILFPQIQGGSQVGPFFQGIFQRPLAFQREQGGGFFKPAQLGHILGLIPGAGGRLCALGQKQAQAVLKKSKGGYTLAARREIDAGPGRAVAHAAEGQQGVGRCRAAFLDALLGEHHLRGKGQAEAGAKGGIGQSAGILHFKSCGGHIRPTLLF